MFNLPPNIFNSPYLQNLVGQAKKPGWSEVNPFRTVSDTPDGRGAGAYGKGLNASASQLYDHFRQDGGWAVNAGLPRAGMTQSFDLFNQRFNPQPVQPPQINVPPPKNPAFTDPGFNFSQGIFNVPQFNRR